MALIEADKLELWKKALMRAALKQAVSVKFSKTVTSKDNSISYELASYDASDKPIGDDRDYDLLKAVMTPLENLADTVQDDRFSMSLDLVSGVLKRN